MFSLQNTYLGLVISENIGNDIVSKGFCSFVKIIPEDENKSSGKLKLFRVTPLCQKVILNVKSIFNRTLIYIYYILGQFGVRYHLKLPIHFLGESYDALKRSINLDSKQMKSLMKEYLDLGHMSQTIASKVIYSSLLELSAASLGT